MHDGALVVPCLISDGSTTDAVGGIDVDIDGGIEGALMLRCLIIGGASPAYWWYVACLLMDPPQVRLERPGGAGGVGSHALHHRLPRLRTPGNFPVTAR